MTVSDLFKTTTNATSPLDGSGGTPAKPTVSEFLTIQSLSNFAAMTGAITAAWNGLQRLSPRLSTLWVPYVFAGLFGLVSVLISLDGLKKDGQKVEIGVLFAAIFIAVLNSLVLASAVVGVDVTTTPAPVGGP